MRTRVHDVWDVGAVRRNEGAARYEHAGSNEGHDANEHIIITCVAGQNTTGGVHVGTHDR